MKKAVERERNKQYYRVLHVPIWIWVFFTLPGTLTARLYQHGPNREHWIWLGLVTVVCAWRGWKGRLPGAESRPYITFYGVDWPNLPYRVICYTAAWIDILVPFTLNLAGLVVAATTGRWIIAQLYGWPYRILALAIIAATAFNWTPRARRSVQNEGAERAWFYVGVWTAVFTQIAAWGMWRLGPALGLAGANLVRARLVAFLLVSAGLLALGLAGKLPRTARYHYSESGELQPAHGGI